MKRIILIVLGLFAFMTPVFANSMPPTSIPGKAGIFVDKESGIELIDENITMNIDDELNKTRYLINYTFKNINDKSIETPIWFLRKGYLNSHDFKVYIENIEIKSEVKDVKFDEIENWEPEEKLEYIDPFTDEVFDSGIDIYSGDYFLVDEFILRMDSNQIADVVIEYEVWNGYISSRVTDYMYDIKLTSYMLSPAAFYEGDGTVDIEIIAPSNIIMKSNLKLDKKNDNLYEIKDYQLKEYENLYLSFSKKPGITELFAYNKTGFKIRLLTFQILLLLTIIIIKNTKYKKILKWIFLISLIAYIRTVGYGIMFWIVVLFRFFWIPILIAILIILYIKLKKKKDFK
ncbi:hypothetical protein QUF55_05350 [Clostridiaceae bacterium HSG29]|nr:hypothetical protein [Clostridiaceae bacterium HSG29]